MQVHLISILALQILGYNNSISIAIEAFIHVSSFLVSSVEAQFHSRKTDARTFPVLTLGVSRQYLADYLTRLNYCISKFGY